MQSAIRIAVCCAAFAILGLAFGQEELLDKGADTSLSFKAEPIQDALARLLDGHASFMLSTEISGLVSGEYRGMKRGKILRALLTPLDATYHIDGNTYVIISKPEALRASPPNDRPYLATMLLHEVDVRIALRGFFSLYLPSINYSVGPDIQGTVDMDVRNVNPGTALSHMADKMGATLTFENGTFQFRKKIDNVTIKFESMDVREALRALFRTRDVNYSIAPEVQGVVSGQFSGSFDVILNSILGQVSATYRIESGIYQIIMRPSGSHTGHVQ